jgi:hypothetical protein
MNDVQRRHVMEKMEFCVAMKAAFVGETAEIVVHRRSI